MRYGQSGAVAVAALLAMAGAARAELTLCNQDSVTINLAVGSLEEGTYLSRGWTEIRPGNCATVIYTDLAGYVYFRIDSADFTGDGYGFCVEADGFYIEGDEDCVGRGYQLADFKALEVPAGQTRMVVNLGPGGTILPGPELPVIDLTRPFTPPAQPGPQPQPAAEGDRRIASGLVEGANGEPFQLDGVFQGCESADGYTYCAFHAEGWKFFAYQGGPTPDAFLAQMDELAMGTPITVAGDIISEGDISAEVALREVVAHAEDPFGAWRAAMQGDWVSTDDPQYRMTVNGSEAFEFYAGEQTGVRFLRIAGDCAESAGTGPVLLTTELEQFETQCFLFQDGLPDRLILALAGQGGFVSFERPR